MKRARVLLSSVCLLLIAACCVHGEQIDWEIANLDKVAQPPQSLSLEYKFTEGEARRYDVKVSGIGNLKLPGQNAESKLQTSSELTFEEQTLSKDSPDVWRISRKLVKGEMTLPDFGKLPISAPTIEIEMDKYGAVKAAKGLDQLSSTFGLPPDQVMSDILSQMKCVGFPRKELKVNDEWTDQYTVQLTGQKPIAIPVVSTLVGFDRVLKTDCATIVTKYEAPFSFSLDGNDEKKPDETAAGTATSQEKQKMLSGVEKGEFRTYFSYSDGKIMQSFGTIELTADLDTVAKEDKPAAPATASAEAKPEAATPATAASSGDAAKHDLDVKYYVTSVFTTSVVKELKPSEKGSAR